jgi:hypothetical protein
LQHIAPGSVGDNLQRILLHLSNLIDGLENSLKHPYVRIVIFQLTGNARVSIIGSFASQEQQRASAPGLL